MKFENVGNWMKEAEEDKLVFDNREPADYLNGDDEICTLKTEDDESDYDDDFSGELLDEVESDENELESPDNEEDAIIMANESCHRNETYRIDKDGETIKTKVVTAKEAMDFISQQQKQDKEKGEKHDYEVFSESAQKNEALDKEKAMELIGAWKSSLMGDNGDFEMHLAKACQYADKNNLMKLEKAFPQLLQKFCAWKSSGKTDRVAQL